jgi:hypothetical protein
MSHSVIYKHLAPLEPEHRLVAAFLRCISVVAKRPGNTHHGDTEDAQRRQAIFPDRLWYGATT